MFRNRLNGKRAELIQEETEGLNTVVKEIATTGGVDKVFEMTKDTFESLYIKDDGSPFVVSDLQDDGCDPENSPTTIEPSGFTFEEPSGFTFEEPSGFTSEHFLTHGYYRPVQYITNTGTIGYRWVYETRRVEW